MATAAEIREAVTELHQEGAALVALLRGRKRSETFEPGYQGWYSRALPLVKHLAPDRLADFRACYEVDPKRKWLDHDTWAIHDHFTGNAPTTHMHCEFDRSKETRRCLVNQLAIFKSLESRIGWRLLDMEDELRVELYGEELKVARSLIRQDARAAGALAHTVHLGYLKRLSRKHGARTHRKEPRSADFAEALREAGVLDAQVKAQVTWLGQIGERCIREDEAVPTPIQVRDLVDGTDWLIKHVF
jgi:hypothetical protein